MLPDDGNTTDPNILIGSFSPECDDRFEEIDEEEIQLIVYNSENQWKKDVSVLLVQNEGEKQNIIQMEMPFDNDEVAIIDHVVKNLCDEPCKLLNVTFVSDPHSEIDYVVCATPVMSNESSDIETYLENTNNSKNDVCIVQDLDHRQTMEYENYEQPQQEINDSSIPNTDENGNNKDKALNVQLITDTLEIEKIPRRKKKKFKRIYGADDSDSSTENIMDDPDIVKTQEYMETKLHLSVNEESNNSSLFNNDRRNTIELDETMDDNDSENQIDIPNSSNSKGNERPKIHPKSKNTYLIVYPFSAKFGIPLNVEDYKCLEDSTYLNDVIIDFYLRYLMEEILDEKDKKRTHIFSSHFYSRLANPINRNDPEYANMSPAEIRHAGVRRWTKNTNIFEKDFIVIPINKHSHWFLAIICFPGLVGVFDDNDDDYWIERPCILIFDSLSNNKKDGVCRILREYLKCEYALRMKEEKSFSSEKLKVVHPKVLKQTNATDCGLYLLEYAKSFFTQPIRDFTAPLDVSYWFPRRVINQKRREIANLIGELANDYHESPVKLPQIILPPETALSDDDDTKISSPESIFSRESKGKLTLKDLSPSVSPEKELARKYDTQGDFNSSFFNSNRKDDEIEICLPKKRKSSSDKQEYFFGERHSSSQLLNDSEFQNNSKIDNSAYQPTDEFVTDFDRHEIMPERSGNLSDSSITIEPEPKKVAYEDDDIFFVPTPKKSSITNSPEIILAKTGKTNGKCKSTIMIDPLPAPGSSWMKKDSFSKPSINFKSRAQKMVEKGKESYKRKSMCETIRDKREVSFGVKAKEPYAKQWFDDSEFKKSDSDDRFYKLSYNALNNDEKISPRVPYSIYKQLKINKKAV